MNFAETSSRESFMLCELVLFTYMDLHTQGYFILTEENFQG